MIMEDITIRNNTSCEDITSFSGRNKKKEKENGKIHT